MIRKHNFSLHTWRGWKWTVPPLIGLIGEWEGASNWREGGLGLFPGTQWAIYRKQTPLLWRGKGPLISQKMSKESAACWLGTDTCASKYLKSWPNAFWNYVISWWGEHKINHTSRWLPRGWLQHSLSWGNKNTAISGICGWWQLTNTAASCPVSLNFKFKLLQSMSAPVCLLLHHSLNPLLTICPLALVVFLSTILIYLGTHFSSSTVLHYKLWL